MTPFSKDSSSQLQAPAHSLACQLPMYPPHVPPSHPHRLRYGWPPAPHQGSESAHANGAGLRLFDHPDANDYGRATSDIRRLPSYHPLRSTSPRSEWRPAQEKLFSPAARPYQQLPAELEPLRYVELPGMHHHTQFSSVLGDENFDDASIDISVLESQYLDLSDHCPLPSSPSAESTPTSDGAEIDRPPAKRRRTAEWDFPPRNSSDDEYSDVDDDREERRVGLSPFYHSTTETYDMAPTRPRNSYTTHPSLKFTEARKDGRSKRQALACLFCRARKIACGRPTAGAKDQTCNQCARRQHPCIYPTESRRGQHSRLKSLARRAQAQVMHEERIVPLLNH